MPEKFDHLSVLKQILDLMPAAGSGGATAAQIGEVQASPTANTVLDRLKTIAAGVTTLAGHVDGLEGLATSLNGFVDGLETLIGSTNALLTTQASYLDGLEGFVDGLEGILGTTSGAAVITDANGTIQQYVRGLVKLIAALLGPQPAAASLSVVPSADQNPIFDHTNGTKTAVTASATIITTGAGHTFLRITTDVDIVVNTAGATAVDDGTAARIVANVPEVIPVPPSTAIKALSLAGSATVRCTPLKVR